MPLTGHHLINGQWTASPSSFFAVDPATGEQLPPQICEATQQNVNAAMSAAGNAFDRMRLTDGLWAARLLDRIGEEIMALDDELIQRTGRETGLPQARLIAERARMVGQIQMFAQLVRDGSWLDATIDLADPARKPMPKPDVRRMRVGRGPVVVFGASNFPFAFGTLGGDTASALAAGNPVIVKAHPSHPGTSELLASAALKALVALKLPLGLFAMLQGKSNELGAMLVQHPSTAAVGFTGSQRAGRALFDLGNRRPRPIPVFAEMGSLNPLIILPDALASRAESIAKDAANSILLGGGQFCTKPGVILLVGENANLANQFLTALSTAMATTKSVTLLNSNLRDSFVERTRSWEKLSDVKVHHASQPIGHASVSPGLYETCAQSFLANADLAEEAFGPGALLIQCKDLPEAAEVLKRIGGSLTGTVHTDKPSEAKQIIEQLGAIVGRLVFNGYPTGVEVCGAMVHGGPYPATTDSSTTSVGAAAVARFSRMVAWQNVPDELLPPALQNSNPLKIERVVDRVRRKD